MKIRARIDGSKVHQVGYRMLLINKAVDIDLPGFSAQNRVEDGRQVVLVFFEGDEDQTGEFRRFIESNKPPQAEVSSITFQDYQGQVGDTRHFSQKVSSQHLGKGIDAILRMEKKQDGMLEKQDKMIDLQVQMLDKQDKMLDRQDTTIGILKEVKEDTSSIKDLQVQILDKQDKMLDKQDKMLDRQDTTIGILKDVKEDTSSISNGISELKRDAMDSILEKYFELSREIAEIKVTLSETKAKVS